MRLTRNLLTGGFCALALAGTANAEVIFGLTDGQQIVRFDSVGRSVTSTVGLNGFTGGDFLLSIDVRPLTGQLYGLSNLGGIFTINTISGLVTQVGSNISPAPAGNLRSIDFNPTVDRIRLLTSSGTNLRLFPDTAAIAATDTNLAFAVGDVNAAAAPQVVNGAYTNSFAGAATTTLYDLDANLDILTTQNPPNNGTLNTVGTLGVNLATSVGFTGFDISGTTGLAYLVGNNAAGGITSNALYTVNLATGSATSSGGVSGVTGLFRDIAVVPEPTSLALVALSGMAMGRRRRNA